ncbi:MAG: biotin--[acetyl-CoA-carboxylase] ligase [Bacteroidota bacterium]
MNTLFIGQNFVELQAVESTNRYATKLLPTGIPEGTVVLAHHQTAGRGQQGNQWHSAPGKNLTFSLVLYPHYLSSPQIFLLNKLFSVALYDFLRVELPEADLWIKWPNDLLLNRQKVAGMLIENQFNGPVIGSTVAGIGLNVNQRIFPTELYGNATSLCRETGGEYALRYLLEKLLVQIEARILAVRAGRTEQIERDYLRHLFGYQEEVDLLIDGRAVRRYLAGVDRHGRLALQNGQQLDYYNIKEVAFCL